MYNVHDFIRDEITEKHMRLGWRVEVGKNSKLILRYTVLNFDWDSLNFLTGETCNAFLKSESYKNMKKKLSRAMHKIGRLYFEAYSIKDLKLFVEEAHLKIDVDKLISKAVMRKSEKIISKKP